MTLVKSKLRHCEAIWNTYFPARHSFSVYLGFKFWPILATDQIFLPRLRLHVQNLGETIPRGKVTVEIAATSEVSTFSAYGGPFQNIKHFEIDDFISGKVKKFSLKVPSKFLKPNSYMVRVTVWKFEPSLSPFDQLKETFFRDGAPTAEKVSEFDRTLAALHTLDSNIDLHKVPVGVSTGVLLCDWRLLEVLKVHSAAGPAGITSVLAIPAAMLAAVNFGSPIFNFMKEQGAKFIDVLTSNWK